MENIAQFPGRDAIEDEALEWLIRLDGDKPLSAEEERAFDQWLARSPAHREQLKSLNTFWANSNVLSELMDPESIMTLSRKRLVSWFWPLPTVRVAAVASIVVALTLSFVFSDRHHMATNGLYVTAVGQQKNITLADDSRLQLNTNSQIQVDYSEGYRNIRLLQGEVHFEVAKDPDKPFSVYAGSGRVQAVGTAFNVYLKDDNVDVYVTEGRVALASILPLAPSVKVASEADATVELASTPPTKDLYAEAELNGLGTMAAGEGAMLKQTQAKVPGSGADSGQLQPVVELVPKLIDDPEKQNANLAWRQGLLVFSGETLEQAVAEISRYTTVSIEIVDPELRQLKIGGQIQVSDTDSMFKALEANFGLTVKRLSYNRVQVVADARKS